MAFVSSTHQTRRRPTLPSIRSLPELAKHLPPTPLLLNSSSVDEDGDRSSAAVKESTTEKAGVDEDQVLIKPKASSRVGVKLNSRACLPCKVGFRPPE
ncbi:hypothetical protein JCM1840_006183 [Sporobolomyces johnsonii]